MFFDRLTELCLLKFGKTPQNKKVMQTLGVSSGVLSRWKNEGELPNTKALIRISQIFEISLDYLVFGTTTDSNISDDELSLLQTFRKLSHDDQIRVSERADTLLSLKSDDSSKEDVS